MAIVNSFNLDTIDAETNARIADSGRTVEVYNFHASDVAGSSSIAGCSGAQ